MLRPAESISVLPSGAKLTSKTVSKPYVIARSVVPAIPVPFSDVIKAEVVSHSVSEPVYHYKDLFGDGDDYGYNYEDYDHNCNED